MVTFVKVGDLLGRHPDLMDGFNEFLARCEKNGNGPNLLFLFSDLDTALLVSN